MQCNAMQCTGTCFFCILNERSTKRKQTSWNNDAILELSPGWLLLLLLLLIMQTLAEEKKEEKKSSNQPDDSDDNDDDCLPPPRRRRRRRRQQSEKERLRIMARWWPPSTRSPVSPAANGLSVAQLIVRHIYSIIQSQPEASHIVPYLDGTLIQFQIIYQLRLVAIVFFYLMSLVPVPTTTTTTNSRTAGSKNMSRCDDQRREWSNHQ